MTQLVTFALLGQMLGPETAVDTPVNSPVTDDQYFTAAAWNGSEYLVVWRDGRLGVQWDIYGTRVTPSGQVLDVGGIPISTTATRSWRPDVAWDGQNFLVAWADDRLAALNYQVYAKRVSSAGVVLDATALNISPGSADHPHVESLGPGFLVVYDDDRGADLDVYTARVTAAGVVLDPMGRAVSTAPGDQYEPALARRDGGYFVTWTDRRSGYDSVYAARLDTTGAVLDLQGLPLSTHDAGSRAADVSVSATEALVVWEDSRGGLRNIFATRVTPAGVVREPNGIPLSTGAFDKLGPRTAFDGTNFGVLWADTRRGPTDMYFGRVAPSGAPLDGNGLLIATDVGQPFANGPPSLTSAGNGFYASWTVDRGGFYNHDAFSALIGPTGAVTAGPFIVAAGDNVESSPAVAFDGTRHLAVWLDTRDNHDVPSVRSMRLGPSGAPLDAVATALPTLSRVASGPVIAGSDAGVFLVAWADNRTASNSVYAARVQASNGSADAMALALAPMAGTRSAPAVAFGGGNFVVVWQDSRSPGVYAARVTPQGTLLDPGGRPLSLADAGFTAPAIAFTGTQFVVAWERAADIQAVRVAPDLSTFDAVPFQVAAGATSQTRPAVGCGATQCLISWVEASTDIFAARLDVATGAVVDTTPLAVCTVAGAQSSVSTLALGSVYVVGWVDGRAGGNSDVYAARVPAVGPVLDPDGFSVSATPDRETALGLSSGLVVYSRGPTFDSFRVWARTLAISPSGTGGGSGGGSGGTGGGSSGTGGGSGGTGGGSGGSGAGGGGGGVEVMTTDGGWTAAVTCGAPLELDTGWTTVSVLSGAPKGLTTKDGTVRWTPTSDEVGSHVLALTDGTQQATLNVVVTCEPRAYTVGCGCSHAEPWAAALLLVALARRRNRRAQRAARDNAPSAPRNASSATARRGSRS